MTLSRLDLDGFGSPLDLAKRIHEVAPDLAPDFDIAELCAKLDIHAITEIETGAFEAALLMDERKAEGSILLAKGRSVNRRRFSIGHELGHFLIPTHLPRPGQPMNCSQDDLRHTDTEAHDRHKQIEAEANRFAAALLMPPARVRKALISLEPNLREIVQLAQTFAVSREAMARSYVEAHRATIAVMVLCNNRLLRVYRRLDHFPWIAATIGQPVPSTSLAAITLPPGEFSDIEECDADTWFDSRAAARIEVVTEQVFGQNGGYVMVLLRVEGDDF